MKTSRRGGTLREWESPYENNTMSVQHIGWALQQPTGGATRKLVLLALANRVNSDTGLCCPSIDRIAEETELNRSTVKRALADLEANGLIVKVRRQRENGSDTSNEYRFPRVTVSRGGEHPAPPGGRTVRPPEPEVEPEEKPNLAPAARKGPPRRSKAEINAVWDCLSHLFGEPTTKTSCGRRGRVVQSLSAAGATPDEILTRAKSWPNHFDGATLTEDALEKWWDTLGRKPLRRQ